MNLKTIVVRSLLWTFAAAASSTLADAAPMSRAERIKNGVVYINLEDEPPNMDPTKQADAISGMWLGHLYEGLMARDSSGKNIVPGAAERMQISADGKTYTFHLRKNGKWHDGKPVTAHDFNYALQRLVDPKYSSEYAFIAATAQIKNAAEILKGKMPVSDLGVRAIDDFTLEISLRSPVLFFPSLTTFSAFYPVRKDLVEKYKEKFAVNSESIVGNGPFKLTEWVHDTSMRMKKSSNYWNAANIKINAIEAPVLLKDGGAAYNLFLTGGLDIVFLDRERLRVAQKEKRSIRNFPDDSVNWIEINQRPERLFSNEKLRKALRLAINRAELVNKVIGIPGGKPAYGVVPDYMPGSSSSITFRKENPLSYKDGDLGEAKRLINEYLADTKQKNVPTFSILGDSTIKGTLPVEYLQNYLSKTFGTQVTANIVPYRTHSQLMRDGQFDLAWIGWAPDYLDGLTMVERFLSENDNNYGSFLNKQFDALVRATRTEASLTKRSAMLGKAESILVLEKSGVVPCYQPSRAFLIADGLQGYAHAHLGIDPDFRFANWKP
jgi:oligopeptide transport system substrate-binding protein